MKDGNLIGKIHTKLNIIIALNLGMVGGFFTGCLTALSTLVVVLAFIMKQKKKLNSELNTSNNIMILGWDNWPFGFYYISIVSSFLIMLVTTTMSTLIVVLRISSNLSEF